MKLKLFFSILLFIGITECSAQTALDTDGLNNLNNVYLYSLKAYCETLDYSKVKTVYVRRDYFIGDSWPGKINNFEIKYLLSDEYKTTIKENGGRITLVGISTLQFEKDSFYIVVIPFSATYKKKIVNLGNGGGLIVYFDYIPYKKGLIFKSKKWNGI